MHIILTVNLKLKLYKKDLALCIMDDYRENVLKGEMCNLVRITHLHMSKVTCQWFIDGPYWTFKYFKTLKNISLHSVWSSLSGTYFS